MKFLENILDSTEEYRTLERSVANGRTPAMATGLSGIHKAHLIFTMCKKLKRRALILAADESEAARLTSDLNTMGLSTFNATRSLPVPTQRCSIRYRAGCLKATPPLCAPERSYRLKHL